MAPRSDSSSTGFRRKAEAPAVKAFNELMAREERLQSVIVPLGDGLWVGVKR